MQGDTKAQLDILGGWRLTERSDTVQFGVRQQRLLAALAIHGGRSRHFYSGLLWPECTESRALGSLRAALFTVARRLPAAIECHGSEVALAEWIEVDFHQLRDVLSRSPRDAIAGSEVWFTAPASVELLPGWCDEWVLVEQERLRSTYLTAAERRAYELLQQGDFYQALAIAENVHFLEPLRESTVRILIQAHLAMGNRSDAISIFQRFWLTTAREVGARPSSQLTQLLFPPGHEAAPTG